MLIPMRIKVVLALLVTSLVTSLPATNLLSVQQAVALPEHEVLQGQIQRLRQPPELHGSCLRRPFVALAPAKEIGLTTATTPTFLVYVNNDREPDQVLAEVVLKDADHNYLYRNQFRFPNTPGIIRVRLPAPIEVGQSGESFLALNQVYEWNLRIFCDPDDPSYSERAGGFVKRVVVPKAVSVRALQQLDPRNYARRYRQAGIWYESVAILAQQRSAAPTDRGYATAWQQLLQSEGLDMLLDKPIVAVVYPNF